MRTTCRPSTKWCGASTCIAIAAELLALGLGAACASGAGARSGGAGSLPPSEGPIEVEVLADVNEVLRPYRMVGFVEAERLAAPGEERVNLKDLLPLLKERARKLGAEALVELETQPFSREGRRGLRATAIAIVFTE